MMITSDRPSPMRNVDYRQARFQSRATARSQSEVGTTMQAHLRPVRPDEIPGTSDIEAFAHAAADLTHQPRWRTQMLLLAYSGIRESESLRLTVDDVRIEDGNSYVHIWRQLVETDRIISPTGRSLLTDEPPKGGRPRNAWFPPRLIPLLKAAIEDVTAMDGPLPIGERPIFYAPQHGLMRPNNWRKRVFNPAAQALGWEKISKGRRLTSGQQRQFWAWPPHSFRHHAATWMLKELGLPSPLVTQYLGHADSAFTERLYMDRSRTDFGSTNAAYQRWLSRDDGSEPTSAQGTRGRG